MEIIRVTTPAQLEDGLSVRKEVFVEEQRVPLDLEVDEYDASPESAGHIVIYEGEKPVATGRFRPYEGGAAKFQRIAVRLPYRGTGLGRVLLRELEGWAVERGFRSVVLDAQCSAEPFYLKSGYRTISPETFLDAGIEHVRMTKPLEG